MHGRLGLRRRPVRNTSATYLAYVAEKADDTTDFDSEGREFESLRARQVPRQPGSRRNNFPDRTKNSGNISIVIVTPNKETGGVMDIVAAFLALISLGVFAAHTLDAIRTG